MLSCRVCEARPPSQHGVASPSPERWAALLAQALYACEVSQFEVEQVLGQSLDILVWIAKKVSPELPGDLRPLEPEERALLLSASSL